MEFDKKEGYGTYRYSNNDIYQGKTPHKLLTFQVFCKTINSTVTANTCTIRVPSTRAISPKAWNTELASWNYQPRNTIRASSCGINTTEKAPINSATAQKLQIYIHFIN